MKSRFRLTTPASLTALALAAGLAHAGGLQKGPIILTKAKVDKTFFTLNTRPEIPYSPIPLIDKNGKAIDPDATAKLPNGQTITAREYFSQLNTLEAKLNKIGYTLKSKVAIQEIGSPAITPTTLNQQAASLKLLVTPGTLQQGAVPHDKVAPNTALKVGTAGLPAAELKAVQALNSKNVSGDQIHGLLVNPSDVSKFAASNVVKINPLYLHLPVKLNPSPPKMDSIPISHSKTWDWDYGNQWFGAYFDGSFNVSGVAQVPANTKSFGSDLSSFSATTNGKAGVKLFSDNVDIVTYSAGYSGSDSSKQIKLNADVKVIGYTVWSENKTVPNGYKLADSGSIPVIVETPTLQFPVGPFSISGKFGAAGSAGISYSLALYFSNISGNVTPFVKSSAFGQVGGGIDIGIAAADVGVGVNLTLLNDSLTIGANVGIGWLFGFFLMDEFYVDNSLNALSGNVYFFIHESEFFGAFNQQQNFTIFNWGGIQDNSSLINIRNIIPLDWNG